ncbi:hypothetical protein [Paenibacillus puerhi]|uniref:hypothetical protein n=1 Tax=Paenibacillus puerhi TaxID=2692622 RepID=UPI00135B14BB|nr:hypothetical protein [Paenibacillus puerhi]
MSINFSNDDLKRIIETKPVGNFYPYNIKEYNHDAVNEYISKVVGSLASVNNINHEADFRSYGSGYASYVSIFCWKKNGSSSKEQEGVLYIDGIRIYVCRVTPVAVIGKGQVTKHARGGSSDYIESNKVDVLPSGDWNQEVWGIRDVLESYNFTVLDRNFVNQPFPFEAKIPTILAEEPYKLFDAFFYWED